MTVVSVPTLTDSVVQSFFIEALGGSAHPISYLDRFPDTVYSKAIDSLLVRFMYALMGPAGTGLLRQEFLEERLAFEEAGLSTVDLDAAYTNAFAFARLAIETYQLDADASLLPALQRSQILNQDANFRNRATNFLQGARAGGTNLGITLAAISGLDRPVEVIENYVALFDRYVDLPLGVPFLGSTNQPNEAIVIPRQVMSQSAVQTLSTQGEPTRGWFTLSYPAGQNWKAIPVTATINSAVLTVPDVSQFPAGAFVTLTNLRSPSTTAQIDPTVVGWNHVTVYAQATPNVANPTTQINMVNAAGTTVPAPANGNFIALVGYGQTIPIPYNASAPQVQIALAALPLIGPGNVMCSGGPLPDMPVQIQFTNQLSDQQVFTLTTNLNPDKATGITAVGAGGTEQMANILSNPLPIAAPIIVSAVGVSADSQRTVIAARDEHAMRLAVDQLRPVTALITTQPGNGETFRQQANAEFTGAARTEVVRYVTGRANVVWPALDNTHWIAPGVEHEAPLGLTAASQHYQGFHNVSTIQAYTDAALLDATYSTSQALWQIYWDSLIGNFSADQQTLCPGLTSLNNAQTQFLPGGAVAAQPEPLVVTTMGTQGIINDVYPADYFSLPGVNQATGGALWASMERRTGTDYLEIDLGEAQPVNYISFEATHKPFIIDVFYDTLDQAPSRNFLPVTIAPASEGDSVLHLTYDPKTLWQPVTIFFTNSLGGMIYTRFLRIGFWRAPAGTAFTLPIPYFESSPAITTASLPLLTGTGRLQAQPTPQPYTIVPYSVEVRNLRIGRNVA